MTTPCVLRVTPRVKAGLDCGGEDLFLNFSAEYNGNGVPTSVDVDLNVEDDGDGDGYSVKRLDPEAEDRWAQADGALYYTGKAKFTTNHYEHEWVGDYNDAIKLVVELLKNPSYWRYCHKLTEQPRVRFQYSYFVSGNAD